MKHQPTHIHSIFLFSLLFFTDNLLKTQQVPSSTHQFSWHPPHHSWAGSQSANFLDVSKCMWPCIHLAQLHCFLKWFFHQLPLGLPPSSIVCMNRHEAALYWTRPLFHWVEYRLFRLLSSPGSPLSRVTDRSHSHQLLEVPRIETGTFCIPRRCSTTEPQRLPMRVHS